MPTKVVISKKLSNAPIAVSISDGVLRIEMAIEDFLTSLAASAAQDLAKDASKNAGSPAMLMTNGQLAERLSVTISSTEVAETLGRHAQGILATVKSASTVAE